MSIDPDAISSNPSDNPEFSDILAARVSRRGVLAGGLGTAAIGFLGGAAGRAGAAAASVAPAARPTISFTPVPTGSADAFVVPDG